MRQHELLPRGKLISSLGALWGLLSNFEITIHVRTLSSSYRDAAKNVHRSQEARLR